MAVEVKSPPASEVCSDDSREFAASESSGDAGYEVRCLAQVMRASSERLGGCSTPAGERIALAALMLLRDQIEDEEVTA